jgi:hypothetical protein
MMNVGLLAIVGVGGCGLILGVVILVVWAILDNGRKHVADENAAHEDHAAHKDNAAHDPQP